MPTEKTFIFRTYRKVRRDAVTQVNYDLRVVQVLLGLGGNLGEPASAFAAALDALADEGWIIATSRLWRTEAVGPEQPEYLNAAATLHWPGSPISLLERCRELERLAGRDRANEQRWGPRFLDLDLLLGEGVVCAGPALQLPHPRFHDRRFALEPALEVAPDWVHPFTGRTVAEMAEAARPSTDDGTVRALEPGES